MSFSNCYSIGNVPADLDPAVVIGGLIAERSSTPDPVAAFWDTETSGYADSDGGVGHTTSWMKTQSNYESADWDFDTIWEIL